MTLLCSTYFWSVGVMEYWKKRKPSQKDELRIMKSLHGKPLSIMFLGFNSLLLQQAEGN
jgi:hypothetical protein